MRKLKEDIRLKGRARTLVSFTRKLLKPFHDRVRKFKWFVFFHNFLWRHLIFWSLLAMEPGTVSLVKKLLKEGMTFLDLGAYRGYYTLLASKLVGEKGKVFAFEPEPENFAWLTMNLRGKTNVNLIQKAVSNNVGTIKLFLSPSDSSTHRIYDVDGKRKSIEVEVTTLDEFFKDKPYKIDLIKMDIEGAEMKALEGMTNIISKTEFYPKALQESGCSPVEFLNKLIEYGFKLYLIDDEKESVEPKSIDEIM